MAHVHHSNHSLYKHNCGRVFKQEPIPLPRSEGLPVKINTYEDVDEPRFDPSVHLNLHQPNFVRLFPDFDKSDKFPKVNCSKGSPFAYSAPFQVLSEKGIEVLTDIVLRNEKHAVCNKNARGNKKAIRGLYYLSPFFRDFQTCHELRDFFKEIAGEELIPQSMLSNCPQMAPWWALSNKVNLSIVDGCTFNKNKVPLDPWHWDSVAYTGVILLNDMSKMVGGELEMMMMDKKKGLQMLEDDTIDSDVHIEKVGYEAAGKMILAQGSEVLHKVSPVLCNQRRISIIMAYAPANCYQPPKSVLATMRKLDAVHQMADYEYFLEKAWQCSYALKGYTLQQKYTKDNHHLAKSLRVVAEELNRAADLLEDKEDDTIHFYDEVKKKVHSDYTTIANH